MYTSPIMAQSQISRTLRGEAARSRIVAILSQEQFDSRRALGRRICEEFSFVDATGRFQVAGCMKALATLAEGSPEIVLPRPRAAGVDNRPRQLSADVAEPVGVPSHPAEIGALDVRLVATASDRALWNTLMYNAGVLCINCRLWVPTCFANCKCPRQRGRIFARSTAAP